MPDWKATLNLPRTDFPMKANLQAAEPEALARWKEIRLYERIQQSRAGRPKFVLHDGPPYANGKIHIGTAMNKVAVNLARLAGYQRVWLSVEITNMPAIRSYQKAGFKRIPSRLLAHEIEMEVIL